MKKTVSFLHIDREYKLVTFWKLFVDACGDYELRVVDAMNIFKNSREIYNIHITHTYKHVTTEAAIAASAVRNISPPSCLPDIVYKIITVSFELILIYTRS